MSAVSDVPFPPLELANRVGAIADQPDPFGYYTNIGAGTRAYLLDVLPADWSFAGKRILDFGCGAGRTLRHFLGEAKESEIWGCDIDEPSIAWLRANLSPPLHAVPNGPVPPLTFDDKFFDFVYVISVFTHLTDSWSAWLLEMHRILADDGILIATFMGEGLCDVMSGEPWVEDRIGMNVYSPDQEWDKGGPMVLHSPWWIRAHWGRAFEILDLHPYGFLDQGVSGQGVVVMRKRPGRFTTGDLEALEPGEVREHVALKHMIDSLQSEVGQLRAYARSLQEAQA